MSTEQKEKMAAGLRKKLAGVPLSKEHIAKLRLARKKDLSPAQIEQCRSLAAKQKGKTQPACLVEKRRKSNTGKTRSPEIRQKMSEAQKAWRAKKKEKEGLDV